MAASMVQNAPPRRADRILDAIQAEVNKRRSLLNNDPDLQSVTIVVRLHRGAANIHPRAVQMQLGTDTDL